MGKRQDFINLAKAGGSRQDFIDLAASHGVHDPAEALTIFDMLMSGALPSELKHGGIASLTPRRGRVTHPGGYAGDYKSWLKTNFGINAGPGKLGITMDEHAWMSKLFQKGHNWHPGGIWKAEGGLARILNL